MKLHHIWMTAALALSVHTGATFAEVVLSTSNDPSEDIGASIGALMGAEKSTRDSLSGAQMAALATGPEATGRSAKKDSAKIEYSLDWLMAQPAPSPELQNDAQFSCLKQAVYFESRGEGLKGQFAVAEVVLNRVDSPAYPNTICGVVAQGGPRSCQFSFNCDGKAEIMHESGPEEIAARIAAVMLQGAPRDLTDGATHFHTKAVNPSWSRVFEQTASYGSHVFYRN